MIQVNPDLITVLTSCNRDLLTTKRHHQLRGARWRSDQYGNVMWWRAAQHVIDSFDSLGLLLNTLESDPRSCIIRDVARDDTDASRCRRKIDFFEPQPEGLRVLGVDIDELMVRDVMGVEEITPTREGLEAAVEAVIAKLMPAGLQGCSVHYQWSSSAGVKSWNQYRLHLWFWLDRPVFRTSLKEWAKKIDGIDASFYDSVRVCYTAAPVFISRHGGEMDDILGRDARGSLRSGQIKKQTDTGTAPGAWLSRGDWEAKEAIHQATRDRLNRINIKRQQEAMRRDGGKDRVLDIAHKRLNTIGESMVHELPGTGRHDHVRAKCRAAFGLRDLIPANEIARVVIGFAITALQMSGRKPGEAQGEAKRLIDPLINSTREAPAFPLSERDLCAPTSRPALRVVETIGDAYVSHEVNIVPLAIEEGPCWVQPIALSESPDPISLIDGYATLRNIRNLVREEGSIIAIKAPAGSGKSYAAMEILIERTVSPEARGQFMAPTHALAEEVVETLNERAEGMGLKGWRAAPAAARRGGDRPTCYDFESITAASKASPNGGSKVCHACDHHPSNAKDSGEHVCPFYLAVKVEQVCDVVVKTHARFILQAPDKDCPFDIQVIDEDPTGSMIYSAGLSRRDILKLVADGDLVAPKEQLESLFEMMSLSHDEPIECDAIAARLDLFSWEVSEAYKGGKAATDSALKETLPDERKARFAEAIDWRLIAALKETISDRWASARIKDGLLEVVHTTKVDLGGALRTVYLDATSTEKRARGLLGATCQFIEINVECSPHVTGKWLAMDLGVNSSLHKESARRQPMAWAATIFGQGVGPGTLIVTSMRNRDPETWTGKLLAYAEELGADVIHHKGTEGRGVNRFKDHHTIIIDPWHVPQQVIKTTAYGLCKIAGDDWFDDATREPWLIEARFKLLGAEIIQEVARIRPLSATASRPVTIVIMDKRDPRSLGLPVTEVIDPDHEAWRVLGGITGWHTAPSILGDVIERAQGCFSTQIDLGSPHPMQVCDVYRAITTDPQLNTIRDVLSERFGIEFNPLKSVASTLTNYARKHGGWSELARAGRCGILKVIVDGQKPLPFFFRGKVSKVILELWLRSAGFKRYRLSEEAIWVELFDVEGKLWKSIQGLIKADSSIRSISAPALIEQMVKTQNLSPKQARRMIEKHKTPTEAISATVNRLFARVMMSVITTTAQRFAGSTEHSASYGVELLSNEMNIKLAVWRLVDDLDARVMPHDPLPGAACAMA